jgi:hypothetical protein
LSRDPIEEDGGMSLYVMIRNDSVNRVDLFGLVDDTDKRRSYRFEHLANVKRSYHNYMGSRVQSSENIGKFKGLARITYIEDKEDKKNTITHLFTSTSGSVINDPFFLGFDSSGGASITSGSPYDVNNECDQCVNLSFVFETALSSSTEGSESLGIDGAASFLGGEAGGGISVSRPLNTTEQKAHLSWEMGVKICTDGSVFVKWEKLNQDDWNQTFRHYNYTYGVPGIPSYYETVDNRWMEIVGAGTNNSTTVPVE